MLSILAWIDHNSKRGTVRIPSQMSNIPDLVTSGTSRHSQSAPNPAPAAHTCQNDWRDTSDMDQTQRSILALTSSPPLLSVP